MISIILYYTTHNIGEGDGNTLQYSCLQNAMAEEPGRLQAVGSQSQTWLSNFTLHSFYAIYIITGTIISIIGRTTLKHITIYNVWKNFQTKMFLLLSIAELCCSWRFLFFKSNVLRCLSSLLKSSLILT